jgi:hypothetical protein
MLTERTSAVAIRKYWQGLPEPFLQGLDVSDAYYFADAMLRLGNMVSLRKEGDTLRYLRHLSSKSGETFKTDKSSS